MMNKKAFTQNKNHSRALLSGIFNACQDSLSYKKQQYVEDPRLQPSGVVPSFNKAFTLIELLVVVLIIGILAAIALPQYQKAVEKAKITEAIVNVNAWYRAAQRYYLANGSWPADDLSLREDMDIVLSEQKDFWWWPYVSDTVVYVAYKHKTKGYMIFRVLKGPKDIKNYGLACLGQGKEGKAVCKSLCGELQTMFSNEGCSIK